MHLIETCFVNKMGLLSRQEVLYHETEEALQLPFITLCPFYEDSFLRPIQGFENQQLTFEKYTLTMERNFLLKNFTYKGYFAF